MRFAMIATALAAGVFVAGTAGAALPHYSSVQMTVPAAPAGDTTQIGGLQVFDNAHVTMPVISSGSGIVYDELHTTPDLSITTLSLPHTQTNDPANNGLAAVIGEYYYVQRYANGAHQGYSRCHYTVACDLNNDLNWQALAVPGAGLVLPAQHSSNLNLSGTVVYSVLSPDSTSVSLHVMSADGVRHEFASAAVSPPMFPYATTAGYVNDYIVALAPGASGPVAYVINPLDMTQVQAFTLDSDPSLTPVDMNAGGRAAFVGAASAVDQLSDVSYCNLKVNFTAGVPTSVDCSRVAIGRLPAVGALMNAIRITDENAFVYYRNYQLGGGNFVVDTDHPAAPVELGSLIVNGPVPPAGDQVSVVASNGQIVFSVGNGSTRDYYLLTPGARVGPVTVAVDVKPGSCTNPVILNSNGVLPVAIAGTADVNVRDIKPGSVKLDGALGPTSWSYSDVSTAGNCAAGADGVEDLLLKYDSRAIGTLGTGLPDGVTITVPVTGELNDATAIQGQDNITIVNKTK